MSEPEKKDDALEDTEVIEAMGLVKYDLSVAEAIKRAEEYRPLVDADMNEPEQYAMVRDGERDLKALRLAVEKRRKDLKAASIDYGRKVDSKAKEIIAPMEVVEKQLNNLRTAFDTRAEVARREEAEKEQRRIDDIAARIAGIRNCAGAMLQQPCSIIAAKIKEYEQNDLSIFAEFAEDAELVLRESVVSLRELLGMKQAKEQAEQNEKARLEAQLAEDERRKVEQEEVRKQQAETQRLLNAQQAEIEAAKRRLAQEEEERQRKIAEENRQKEVEKEAERQRELKAKREVAEKEQEEKRIAAEKERIVAIVEEVTVSFLETGFFNSRVKAEKLVQMIINNQIPNIKFYL